MDTKIVFMGSPDFSLPVLSALAERYQVCGVVTQPDRPAGRGQVLTPPPVKQLANQLNIPVIQPNRLKDPGVFEQLLAWQPDVIIVVAFGQILRANVLNLPPWGCINVHASLLPRWRGAAPVQAAILAGDQNSGVTVMKMNAGVDTGAILTRQETPILPEDTAGSLLDRLAGMGAGLLIKTLPGYFSKEILPQAQDESQATYAAMMRKEDGLLDFDAPASVLERKVRAYQPWPGAYFMWMGSPFKVIKAHVLAGANASRGVKSVIGGLPCVGTSEGWLALDEVQPAGKKPMAGEVFVRGARQWAEK